MIKEEKLERRSKVFLNNPVWIAGANGDTFKVKKGLVVLMSAEEIKLFGKAVTKDIPDGAPEFERVI
tara:strand:+ start:2383 stop:2583 length:201 start_codon:yes stop_codon:yes gene_type:complete